MARPRNISKDVPPRSRKLYNLKTKLYFIVWQPYLQRNSRNSRCLRLLTPRGRKISLGIFGFLTPTTDVTLVVKLWKIDLPLQSKYIYSYYFLIAYFYLFLLISYSPTHMRDFLALKDHIARLAEKEAIINSLNRTIVRLRTKNRVLETKNNNLVQEKEELNTRLLDIENNRKLYYYL